MKNEFVPYEITVALKELGFNTLCFAYCDSFFKKDILRTGVKGCVNSALETNEVALPLWQQAFKFFREKYDLTGLVEIGTQEFSYQIFDKKGNKQLGNEPLYYNGSYEEAELECLKKLIEIVKSKNT
jgi:hypothetical protein